MSARMNALINKLDVTGLEQLWEVVSKERGNHVSIIRGLVMDRLENINPQAFERWLDQENESDFYAFQT